MQPAHDSAESGHAVAGNLVFVADCGGTKTAARLVRSLDAQHYQILAEACSSSANPLSVGFENATQAIEEALTQVRAQSRLDYSQPLSRALLSIAGAANPEIADKFLLWARAKKLAHQFAVVSDVLPILAAGTRDCFGIALISGTGSSAVGRSANGRSSRCGGWGFLLGDEGSGFAIGRAAVQHALQKMEAEERLSTLAESVCNHLKANSVTGITRTIYGSSNPRRLVASLAILVVKLAEEEDGEAREILEKAGADLANLVVRTVAIVGNQREVIKIAAAGGVLINSNYVQQRLIAELQNHGLNFEINFVRDPLAGCMRLVEAGFAENLVTWHKSEAT